MGDCPACGGERQELGQLGRRTHYRCRDCGMESSHEAERAGRSSSFDDGVASYLPAPRTKPELNGHLVNDHEYTREGAGNSARNLPRKDELARQHDWLHANGVTGHKHPSNPMEAALVQADAVTAANANLERLSRGR